jgi:predicted transcriptional regulator
MRFSPGILPQSIGAMGNKRQSLYAIIARSPGLHFRELQRRTKMATGQLNYHLHWLQERSVVKTILDGQYLRFYTFENLGDEERKVIELSRQESVRHILIHLLECGCDNHENIVKKVDLSPSTVSWHLKKLVNAKIVIKEVDGRKSFFHINNSELVKKIIVKYRESFMDRIVDAFIYMWDE